MKKYLLYLVIIWATVFQLPAQSPYKLDTGREFSTLGAGALVFGVSIPIDLRTEPLTPEQIEILDVSDVPGIDRWATRQWSLPAQRVSDRFLQGSFFLPATLLLDQPSRTHFGQVSLLTLESLLISAGVTNLTKVLVKRPRPFLYNPEAPMEAKLKKRSRYSFFSGHTSMTSTMTFLSAKMYHDFYPDSNARPYVWASAALIPAVTGYLRMRGGKHYLTDVLIGYGVGALVGVLVPEMHRIERR